MKLIVCVKQVPDTSGKVAVNADGTLDRVSCFCNNITIGFCQKMKITFLIQRKIIFFPGHHSATLISEIVIIIVASYTDNRSTRAKRARVAGVLWWGTGSSCKNSILPLAASTS